MTYGNITKYNRTRKKLDARQEPTAEEWKHNQLFRLV